MVYQATYVISLTFTSVPGNPLYVHERLAAGKDCVSVVSNRGGIRSGGEATLPTHIYK